jgi:uncharacterized membrane protein
LEEAMNRWEQMTPEMKKNFIMAVLALLLLVILLSFLYFLAYRDTYPSAESPLTESQYAAAQAKTERFHPPKTLVSKVTAEKRKNVEIQIPIGYRVTGVTLERSKGWFFLIDNGSQQKIIRSSGEEWFTFSPYYPTEK